MNEVPKKSGIVAFIGRPNSGKSTLLNAILGQKVSITSPKPQTTRFPIQAVYEEERGQIVFVDTPGVFAKVADQIGSQINARTQEALDGKIDVVLYLVDKTRKRAEEENKVLGMVRKINAPKILVINKADVTSPDYSPQYKFLEDEFDNIIEVSALLQKHIPLLLNAIFSYLPEDEPLIDTKDIVQPALNMDSKTFIAEIIREKAFLNLRSELPYSITVVVDDVEEKENGTLYIKARILTAADRYKSMIIGSSGRMVKQIGSEARKELEVASSKQVYLELTVETDTHWMDYI